MTERVILRYQAYDAHVDAMVMVERPFDKSVRVETVGIPVISPGGGIGRLDLTDCGRRDPFGNRVFESPTAAVRH